MHVGHPAAEYTPGRGTREKTHRRRGRRADGLGRDELRRGRSRGLNLGRRRRGSGVGMIQRRRLPLLLAAPRRRRRGRVLLPLDRGRDGCDLDVVAFLCALGTSRDRGTRLRSLRSFGRRFLRRRGSLRRLRRREPAGRIRVARVGITTVQPERERPGGRVPRSTPEQARRAGPRPSRRGHPPGQPRRLVAVRGGGGEDPRGAIRGCELAGARAAGW